MNKTFWNIIFYLLPTGLWAQVDSLDTTTPYPELKLDFTIIDMPYQIDAAKTVGDGHATLGNIFKGYANPSMSQSLSLTSTIYSTTHWGLNKLLHKGQKLNINNIYQSRHNWMGTESRTGLNLFVLLTTDFLLTYAPGGEGWLHEEFHRSVMTRYGVNSFDDMNTFPLGATTVSVNHVKDADLERFKAESSSDFRRMQVAGIEGEYCLIENLQKQNFFYKQGMSHELLYLLATSNSIGYVKMCSDVTIDKEITKMSKNEPEINSRDFTGYDFLGWAYDLFNPNEAYAARGLHPSGTGIDRYRKTADLTSEALSYLEKQGNLQYLNFISPMFFGFRRIRLKDNLYTNFAVRNYLTGFGNDISLDVYVQNALHNWNFAYHHASNYSASFPSLEISMFENKITVANMNFLYSPRAIIGVQPKDQQFMTNDAEFLGALECRIDCLFKQVQPWIKLSAKTDGWIAGNEYLQNNISAQMGISMRIH